MNTGLGGDVSSNLPAGPTAIQLSDQRLKREDAATTSDYIGSIFRQDGLVDGAVANIVGRQMMPDPTYNVHEPKTWTELTTGIDPEYHNAFYEAHSPAHAMFLKDRLLQKQEDVIRLGDMGMAGTVGRLALNALMPDQILIAMAGGGVTRVAKAVQIAGAARGATTGIAAAEAVSGVVAKQTAAAASKGAIAAGIAAGGVGNAAYEKIRQNLNFEDSSSEVVLAGLLGAALTTPFALAGSRAESRIAQAASREHMAYKAMKDLSDGKPLTIESAKVIQDVVDSHLLVRETMAGRMTPEEGRAALDARQMGPNMEDAAWLKPFGEDLEVRGKAILDQMFPRNPAKQTQYVDDELAKLGGGEAPTSIKATMKAARDADLAAKKAAADAARAAAKDAPQKTAKQVLIEGKKADVPKGGMDVGSLQKMVAESDGQVKVADAPVAPPEAPPVAPKPEPMPVVPDVPVEPVAPSGPRVGGYTEFTKRGSDDEMSGLIEEITPEGFVKIRDEDGVLHTVHESRLISEQEVPSGFIGSGNMGAAQVLPIADVRLQQTAMSGARLDIYATLNRSDSEEMRRLVFDLVKDPIQNDEFSAQGLTASEHKSMIKRTLAGAFHREAKQAATEAAKIQGVPFWGRAAFNAEFHSLVSRLTRGDLSIQVVHANILPQLQRASKAQQSVYKQLLEDAKQMGVKGADEVDVNAFYVNRMWNHTNITEALRVHGEDAVIDLLAKAINVPGHIGDKVKARSFLSTIRKLEFSPVMQNIQLYAQDMGSLRKALETEAKLSPSDVDDLVNLMFVMKDTGSDTGRMPNLKYRFDLNETLSANTKGGVFRITDLLENDARVLVDTYTNSMAGRIALAAKGIKSDADFAARLKIAADEAMAHPGWDQDKFKRNMNLMQDVYSNITGRPMSTQDFSPGARIASTMRGYTRALMLGQLGLTAAFEMFQAAGAMGLRATMKQLPSLRQFFYAVRNGNIPDAALARDIEHMVGFGHEMDMSYARVAEIDDSGMGRFLTKAEAGANMASHAVDVMSGNASMTSLTRQWAGMMATQEMHDFATGIKKLTDAQRTRFVGHGLDFYEVDVVLRDLDTYSTASASHKLETVDWERWLKEEPETYQKFQTTLSRKVRDAIQDQDLGETMPFMHTTVGKIFSELKTFMLVAHAKNFLKNLHYRDSTSMQIMAISMVGNALAYMTQTAINFAHDPAELQERLSMERVTAAVMARTALFGVMPLVASSGYSAATGGESLFQPGATTNTDNRSVIPPSGTILSRLGNAPANLMGMARTDTVTTQKEGRELTGLTPNLWGLRNIANYWANTLPKYDPAHPGQ